MNKLESSLKSLANPEKARLLQRFFKTGKGEYGEGDIFLGIMVPQQRKVAKDAAQRLSLNNIQLLLKSKVHDRRMIALFILIEKYQKAKKEKNEQKNKEIFDFYLKNTKNINNWDLVDLSAPRIVGDFLLNKDRSILYKLVKSDNLWERRIAVLSSFMFIKNNDFKDSLNLAESLLKDNHDLIHKAVGWMLREIGKRNQHAEEVFLRKHYKHMPRTMLRYAIERFPEEKRKAYLNGEIK